MRCRESVANDFLTRSELHTWCLSRRTRPCLLKALAWNWAGSWRFLINVSVTWFMRRILLSEQLWTFRSSLFTICGVYTADASCSDSQGKKLRLYAWTSSFVRWCTVRRSPWNWQPRNSNISGSSRRPLCTHRKCTWHLVHWRLVHSSAECPSVCERWFASYNPT